MRQRSLRLFITLTLVVTGWRMLSTIAFLLFGPGLGVAPNHLTTQVFFLLSKAFLGGLFWPVSFALEATTPLRWLLFPWLPAGAG